MTTQAFLSTTVPSMTGGIDASYHGKKPDGRIRTKVLGRRFLVTGFAQQHPAKTEIHAAPVQGSRLLEAAAATTTKCANEMSILATCPKTNTVYRITGIFHRINDARQTCAPTLITRKQDTNTAKEDSRKEVSRDPKFREREVARFHRDLSQVSAQRNEGLDPHVRMSFVSLYLSESKANLYRKMGKGFPKPIKRGHGSFWPMSQIEAYKAGASF